MTRSILKILILPTLVGITVIQLSGNFLRGFNELNPKILSEISTKDLDLEYSVKATKAKKAKSIKDYAHTGKSLAGFRDAIGFKESGNDYQSINKYGYLGKYQFGRSTLLMLGVSDTDQFIEDPLLQEKAFTANLARNKWILRNYIKRYNGRRINGVLITESGILAAAHLSGPGGVKKFLKSGGNVDFSDAFGTTIQHYIQEFGGYDVSIVKPNRLPQIAAN